MSEGPLNHLCVTLICFVNSAADSASADILPSTSGLMDARVVLDYTFSCYRLRHEQPQGPYQSDGSIKDRELHARIWKGRETISELLRYSPGWKTWEKSHGNASPPPCQLSGLPGTNLPLHPDAGLGSAPLAEADIRGHLQWVLLRHTLLALGRVFTNTFTHTVLNSLGPAPELSKTKE